MAVFKVPRITTSQRVGLLLEVGEVVYDTDESIFYVGDGTTLGGFLIGHNTGSIIKRIELNQQDIFNKFVTISPAPLVSSSVLLTPEGGIPQTYGVDYIISGTQLKWDGLGLDGFLDITDVLIIQY
jgi:hypothetical protein